MKTKLVIFSVLFLIMNFSVILANAGSVPLPDNHTDYPMQIWGPVVPRVADFEENVPEPSPALIIAAPTTPKEATFDDEYSPDNSISPELLKSLAPVTPSEADFNDADEDATVSLAPVAPSIADFTDLD